MMTSSPADGGFSHSSSSDLFSGPSEHDYDCDIDFDDSSPVSPVPSKERRRYLYPKIDTVEPLRPEEIRWFYREKDKKWIQFSGYDSLRVECKYREYVHNTRGKTADNVEMINVRGGLYEVDVVTRKCYPVYWSTKDQTANIMRGVWFVETTWQPIEEAYADQIETEHLAKFAGQKIPEETPDPQKGPLPVIHNIKFKEFHVDWNAIDKVYLFSEAASSKFYRALGNKLGLSKSGSKLCRGYCYEATMDDKPPDISHLVFVVHGIGQKMETGSIIRSCSFLREACRRMKEKYFLDLELDNKRVEFLPVEWRSSLKLDGDTVESITPNKVKGLRTILNSSAMDILYYTSPLYRAEITQGLQTELNRLYSMFCARHPYFEATGGKVSIVAHSLGCVITYDIVTGWNPIQLYDQYVSNVIEEQSTLTEGAGDLISQLEKARQRVSDLEAELMSLAKKQHLKTPTLRFKLDNFFCLGSPLAVFLALRGVLPKSNRTQDHILDKRLCSRVYNIYHPSDPIAYRIEPLIVKHYATIMPMRIHRHDSTKKEAYEKMKAVAYAAAMPKKKKVPTDMDDGKDKTDGEKNKIPEIPKSSSGALHGLWKKFQGKSPAPDPLAAEMRVLEKLERTPETESEEDEWVNMEVKFERFDGGVEQTELDYRLDYQLKEGKMENAYLSAVTSHTSYWTNLDVALFIMTAIFPNYGPR